MSWLTTLTEQQIARARAKGAFDNLPGDGKPLPDLAPDFADPLQSLGFRIMAEAGVLPPEITLKKAAALQRAHLATLTDEPARKSAMAALADLELRQAIAEEARRNFMS